MLPMIAPFSTPALLGFGVALLVCLVLVATVHWHGHLSIDSMDGIQKLHDEPTPRVGGIAIAAGLLAAGLALQWHEPQNAQFGAALELFDRMMLASLPAWVVGLVEDGTKRVRVRDRLLATLASALLGWWLTGYSLTRVDVWGLDLLLTWVPFAVVFTAVAVAGAANAINIIDGLNGLAGGALTLAFAALGLMAAWHGDAALAGFCTLFAAVTVGFLCVNFPRGRIFLGDGGAYALGFLMGWVAIMLPMRNPAVSVWGTLMACAYPILEVGFSIWRRIGREGHHPGLADRVHLHQLVYRRVAGRLLGSPTHPMRNALAALIVLSYALLCAVVAVLAHTSTPALIVGFLACGVLYRAVYYRLTQFRWCWRPATTQVRVPPAVFLSTKPPMR